MPFSLPNSLSSFQHFINDIFQGYFDILAIAHINNILVNSNLLPEHKKHIKLILNWRRDAGLQLDIVKSKFYIQEVTFFKLLIGKKDIQIDLKKVEIVQN